ncbi:alpha/beta fold hydrolase [Sedimentimonas flavescens]|uniref:Alpha/beta fold hydrolase n=1 Tax=Sedimentimonas flavescens TaxID=2851012 RepID=A0ABT2ZXG2_9RHOB|nr:alpha/beta fold hydrolase [Sedimentimonas flavescens]MCV2878444.1 alpha/beta fold hydrolase [Sedimentimonas flavescens]
MTTSAPKARRSRVKAEAAVESAAQAISGTVVAERPEALAPKADKAEPIPNLPARLAEVLLTDTPEKLAAEEAFVRLDRLVHAQFGKLGASISPISLALAWGDWAAHLAISPGKRAELVWKSARKAQRLAAEILCQAAGGNGEVCVEPLKQDRRFAGPEWLKFPFSLYSQSFLLTQQWWHNATSEVHGVEERHEKVVEFYGRQFLDMFSPSNFLLTNPHLIQRTVEEGGRNLTRGAQFFYEDMMKRMTGQPEDPPEFTPGHEVAITPGKVVFRNRLIELIQYAPTTPAVHSVPLLIVPAWIMKYYILDLTPPQSMIKWLVDQGFSVFCISWKNPDEEDRELGFDDYRELGVMAAIDAISAITGAEKVHGLGYCLGGTLLSVTAAAMARDGDERLASMTMLAAQVDFTEAGELSLFTNESQLSLLEDMMWEEGYLDKEAMAGTFSMLKSQDLVWSKMVREYMLGEREAPSSLGAWSHDATRMPYKMHSEYLRKLFLNNDLADGRMTAGEGHIYLQDIKAPVFAVATEHDHIAPWNSVFKLTYLMHGDVTFALVSGGHNTGIVAPPGSARAKHRIMTHVPGHNHPAPEDWAKSVPKVQGSWWEPWADWLRVTGGAVAGPDQAPPPMGNADAGYKPLQNAPGRYVLKQ